MNPWRTEDIGDVGEFRIDALLTKPVFAAPPQHIHRHTRKLTHPNKHHFYWNKKVTYHFYIQLVDFFDTLIK